MSKSDRAARIEIPENDERGTYSSTPISLRSVAERLYNLEAREKRVNAVEQARYRLASGFEIAAIAAIAMLMIALYATYASNGRELLYHAVSDPLLLFVGSVLFLEVFTFLLTAKSLLVTFVAKMRRGVFRLDAASSSERSINLSTVPGKQVSPDVEGVLDDAAQLATDAVARQIARMIERSTDSVRSAQRRPNALLFVGTVVAGIGLVFFLATLPGFLTPAESGQTLQADDLGAGFWTCFRAC